MGCGFSTQQEGKSSSDENAINGSGKIGKKRQKSSFINGNNLVKELRPKSASSKSVESTNDSLDGDCDRGGDDVDEHRAVKKSTLRVAFANRPINQDGTIQILSEVSGSQIDFFKMLDEKIERGGNGIDFETEIEGENTYFESDWKSIIQLTAATSSTRSHTAESSSSSTVVGSVHAFQGQVADDAADEDHNDDSDSLKTAYSNSVNLPFSTIVESPSGSTPCASPRPLEPVPMSRTPFFSETASPSSISPPTSLNSSTNRSIVLNNVLQDALK